MYEFYLFFCNLIGIKTNRWQTLHSFILLGPRFFFFIWMFVSDENSTRKPTESKQIATKLWTLFLKCSVSNVFISTKNFEIFCHCFSFPHDNIVVCFSSQGLSVGIKIFLSSDVLINAVNINVRLTRQHPN